ncbi:hypothetical protein DFJ43DRAFT_1096849 [Lentinula guzmanii]|uniref:Protein kinase domain-containing protein n=1 Tax=Lentinula guzmanii TaxID=2804957 RepID=A0AA38MXC4_9AGAR|nr:hypothetical protein DFJ43DRAFT_1096849 [Lentinula guzmanii]
MRYLIHRSPRLLLLSFLLFFILKLLELCWPEIHLANLSTVNMFKEISTLGFSLFTFWSLYLLSPFPTACAAPAPGGFGSNIYDVTRSPEFAHANPVSNPVSNHGQAATVAAVWGQKPYYLFRSWMTDFYPAIISRDDKNKYFKDGDFTRYLGGGNLAVDGEERVGRYNVGVFEYKPEGTSNSNNLNMVIKVLSHPGLDDGVYGEAITLDLMGLYDKSGFVFCNTARSVKDPRTGKIETVNQYSKYPAILMRRVDGVPIDKTPQWNHGGDRTKNRMMAVVKSLVKTQVMSIWAEHGFIYMDLNIDNVHISFDSQGDISAAHLFDFGYPGVVAVKRGTTQTEIEELFEQCWNIFWPSDR